MVFITGPRQVGKTYFSKEIQLEFRNPVYLNNDGISDMELIRRRSWPLNTDLVILDEIHNFIKILPGLC